MPKFPSPLTLAFMFSLLLSPAAQAGFTKNCDEAAIEAIKAGDIALRNTFIAKAEALESVRSEIHQRTLERRSNVTGDGLEEILQLLRSEKAKLDACLPKLWQ